MNDDRSGVPAPSQGTSRYSVAMTADLEENLREHLLRPDGQESLCLAVYQPSTGLTRFTAILNEVALPLPGEMEVHGNVSFTGNYVLRVAAIANECGGGVAILHSHPGARGWQGLSEPDRDAEASFANLVREVTGLPLLGMTLAGASGTWSARVWCCGTGTSAGFRASESVRVIGDQLRISWNSKLLPPPRLGPAATRSVSCWGPERQGDISRLRILVVGAGTLGLDVALRLAATGVRVMGLMDYDTLKLVNLDRMIGASALDASLHRSKVEVVARLAQQNATALGFVVESLEGSICEPDQFAAALDYDLIFCCVDDHPWPRSVLNAIAYADLIPVIDGGIQVDVFPDGDGMRNATWRSHVLRPGRPCMACNGQLDLGKVQVDKAGLLDDPTYIAGLWPSERPQGQNVAALAISAAASLLAQLVSFLAAPAGFGEPGPLRYSLSTHWLERVEATSREHCPVERSSLAGDRRQVLLGEHAAARGEMARRKKASSRFLVKLGQRMDDALSELRYRLIAAAEKRLQGP